MLMVGKGLISRLQNRKGQMMVEMLFLMTGVMIGFLVVINICFKIGENNYSVAQSSLSNLLSASLLYKADVGHFPAGSTASEICPVLTKSAIGTNGKEVGPWLSKCEETTPWGEPIMFDAEHGVVYAKVRSGKYLSTVDLSQERKSWR